MFELFFSPASERDLEKIYEYTFVGWGADQADKYQDELYNACNLICNDKELGKEYNESKFPYRVLHINRHLIFYRSEKKYIIIIRILHERMKLEDNLP